MAYRLAGQATLDTGAAASRVVVRDWSTHAHVAAVTPDEAGYWSVDLGASGPYDVTTVGPDGYQPICHGPVYAAEMP